VALGSEGRAGGNVDDEPSQPRDSEEDGKNELRFIPRTFYSFALAFASSNDAVLLAASAALALEARL
jgi:hypothetical protein